MSYGADRWDHSLTFSVLSFHSLDSVPQICTMEAPTTGPLTWNLGLWLPDSAVHFPPLCLRTKQWGEQREEGKQCEFTASSGNRAPSERGFALRGVGTCLAATTFSITTAQEDCLGWGRENRKTESRNKSRVVFPLSLPDPGKSSFSCSDLKERLFWRFSWSRSVRNSGCRLSWAILEGKKTTLLVGWYLEFWSLPLICLLALTFQCPQPTHILPGFTVAFNGDKVEVFIPSCLELGPVFHFKAIKKKEREKFWPHSSP